MNIKFLQTPEGELQEYLVSIEFWSPDFGETDQMLGARKYLQEHLADLSGEQRRRLRAGDARVLQLLAGSKGDVTRDLIYLKQISEFISRAES